MVLRLLDRIEKAPNKSETKQMKDDRSDSWHSREYQQHANFVPALGQPLITILAPQVHEVILDLGCGDGALTQHLVSQCKHVVGIDASANMIEQARSLGIDAHVVDGHALPYKEAFDGIISNAALHWMTEPDKVLSGCFRALKPGGRMVGEFGGAGNVSAIVSALNNQRKQLRLTSICPWYFPGAEEYQQRLEQADFEVEQIVLFERKTPLPTKLSNWLETFGHAFFVDMSAEQQQQVIKATEKSVEPALKDSNGTWYADYVRLRFMARKPNQ